MIDMRFRLTRDMRRATPLLVWTLVLVVTATLYLRVSTGITVTGYVETVRYSVAPETTGRLEGLEVLINQDVAQGQIVATLNDRDLILQLEEARTELKRLSYELGRELAEWELDSAGQQIDQQTNLRRFARDAESAHIAYLDEMSELAEARIELQGLELTLGRTRQLVEQDLISPSSLDTDRIAYEAHKARVDESTISVETLRRAYQAAETRYGDFLDGYLLDTPDSARMLRPYEQAVAVQRIRVEQVNLAIVRRVLRAPVEGRVVDILRRPGEIVAAGEVVVSILEPETDRIVAYVPEDRLLDREPGEHVKIRRLADPRQVYEARITALGAWIEQLPARLDPAARTPRWGYPVHLQLPDSLGIRPGEAFDVSF